MFLIGQRAVLKPGSTTIHSTIHAGLFIAHEIIRPRLYLTYHLKEASVTTLDDMIDMYPRGFVSQIKTGC